MYILRNWSVIEDDDGYTAPELRRMVLIGEVYGHPKYKDGSMIKTSVVITSEGRTIQTKSGTYYRLDEPSQMYLDWLKENNLVLDEKQPIKIIYPEQVKSLDNNDLRWN